MTAELERIAGLIRDHQYIRYRKVLTCARNVWDALLGEFPERPPANSGRPWEGAVSAMTGIEVTVVPSYRPGQWRLTRHDHCEVTGGDETGQPLAVSHGNCTVLAESRYPPWHEPARPSAPLVE